MGQKEPFGDDGRTVIRPSDGPQPIQRRVLDAAPRPAAPDPTVFLDGAIPKPAAPSPTMFHDGPLGVPAQPNPAPKPTTEDAKPAFERLDRIGYASPNSLMRAAMPLLLLLAGLRARISPPELPALGDRLQKMIEAFDRSVSSSDISKEDARIAKFALCEAADEAVLAMPGVKREQWSPHEQTYTFFGVAYSGSGFFDALNKVLSDPEQRVLLIELMHACLATGFEGQYRAMPDGRKQVRDIRADVYGTLRYFKARENEEISPHWQGLTAASFKRGRRIPVWAVAAASIAVVAGAFFLMRAVISTDGDALADELLALQGTTPVTLVRPVIQEAVKVQEPAPPPIPKSQQIDRIRAALDEDIKADRLTVDTKGDFIVLEINNQLLFQSGGATLKADFTPVAERIVAALDVEKGPVKIVGHTDNVKPKKSGTFKSNYDLSLARAKAVEKLLAPKLADASRVEVEGKGEDVPVADNATQEGRAKNRRVDVMLRREEAL